jgi:signal peptidase II
MSDDGRVTPTDETAEPGAADNSAGRHEAGAGAVPERPRRIGVFVAVALIVIALDVLSKVLVVANLQPAEWDRILGGVFYLGLARNSGAAFSLGTGFTVILSVVALGVVAVIVRTASRLRSIGWAVALGLVLGGAIGNLADRVFRSPGVFRGRVIDWISLFGPGGVHWPIFNLADSAIVCGAILAAILTLFGIGLAGDRDGEGDQAGDAAGERGGHRSG